MDKNSHGVGESFEPLVLRARLISRLSSWEAGGVGGPRAHSSRTASTSAASAARSAVAAGDCSGPAGGGSDGSSVVGMARALLTGTAHGFAQAAVDGTSSLSLVSRLMDGDDDFFATQNVSPRLQKEDTVDNRSGFSASLSVVERMDTASIKLREGAT